jgi:hypothetical protein
MTVRTGRAVVVILVGTRRARGIILRDEIHLDDPWVPESFHPHHQKFGSGGALKERAYRNGCDAARRSSRRAVHRLIGEMRAHGLRPRGVGIVVGSLADPTHVHGAHARTHAQERVLYRKAVEAAFAGHRMQVMRFLDKSLRRSAPARLERASPKITATLRGFAYVVGTPWRAPEKDAALAAWFVFAR